MKRTLVVLLCVLIPLLAGSPAYAASYQHRSKHHGSSAFQTRPFVLKKHLKSRLKNASQVTAENWSGYAVTGATDSYSSVTSTWVQPTMDCQAVKGNSYSSYWVGLDGYSDATVEQIGTQADCSAAGKATYASWYEMYPSESYEEAASLAIVPGNTIQATVNYTGTSSSFRSRSESANFTLTLTNKTTGKTFTIAQSLSRAPDRSSAEVIAEAPSDASGILPLADFVNTSFTNSLANTKPLGTMPGLEDIIMNNPAGMTATPSTFDTTNKIFSVAWSK